jgi:hypothetical protein
MPNGGLGVVPCCYEAPYDALFTVGTLKSALVRRGGFNSHHSLQHGVVMDRQAAKMGCETTKNTSIQEASKLSTLK